MKTKHTSGPWIAQGSLITQGGHMKDWMLKIASLPTTIDPRPCPDAAAKSIEEREANARLIAAAPELLAALQDCIETLEAATLRVEMENKAGNPVMTAWLGDAYKIMDAAKLSLNSATGEEMP